MPVSLCTTGMTRRKRRKRRKRSKSVDLNHSSFILDYQQLFDCNRKLSHENAELKKLVASYATSVQKSAVQVRACKQAVRAALVILPTAAKEVKYAAEISQNSETVCNNNSQVLWELTEDLVHHQGEFDSLLSTLNSMEKVPGDVSKLSILRPTSEVTQHRADMPSRSRNISATASGLISSHINKENDVSSSVGDLNVETAAQKQKGRYSTIFDQALPESGLSRNKGQRVCDRENQMLVIEELEDCNRTSTQSLVMKSPTKVASLEENALQDSACAISPPSQSTSQYQEPDICRNNEDDLDYIEYPVLSDIPSISKEDIHEEGATNDVPYNLRKRTVQKVIDPFLDASWLQDSAVFNETVVDPGDESFVLCVDRTRKNTKGKKKVLKSNKRRVPQNK